MVENQLCDPSEVCALDFKREFLRSAICSVPATIGPDAASTGEIRYSKRIILSKPNLLMPADPLSILKTVFGYDTFRGRQREVIEHVLAGNHAFVLMPTGGGKSLCYQIPALARPGIGLIISPLIALMEDQV